MVRKTSFLGKIFSKKKQDPAPRAQDQKKVVKSGGKTAVKVKTKATHSNRIDPKKMGAPIDPKPRVNPEVEVKTQPRVLPLEQPTRVPKGKKEEAQKAIVNGFQDLSQLLNGIQTKMEHQGEQNGELIAKFDDMPEAARAQITFLKKISTQMADQQNNATQMLEKFGQVPELLAGVKEILAGQQKADERRDQTLGRFRETMDRINSGITSMSRDNKASMENAAKSIKDSQGEAVNKLERSQGDILKTFQTAHERQTRAMTDAMAGSAKQSRLVLVFLAGAILAMTAVFILILSGGLN